MGTLCPRGRRARLWDMALQPPRSLQEGVIDLASQALPHTERGSDQRILPDRWGREEGCVRSQMTGCQPESEEGRLGSFRFWLLGAG